MNRQSVLISGAGIAGLTLAIHLKQHGFEPLVIERDTAPRRDGYMMDFFGTGWDVVERMGLAERLRAIHYPIDALAFVDDDGEPYCKVPVERIRGALGGHYTYLRRGDLEQILIERARELAIEVRYATSLHALAEQGSRVHATFVGGGVEDFALVIGADGVHSRVRTLAFGLERQFTRSLGLYVAALHVDTGGDRLERHCKLYAETDRTTFFYPVDSARMDATYIFRHDEQDVPPGHGLAFVREQFRGGGWITEQVLRDYSADSPLFFDSVTQIVMPRWHRGRIALVGDACGCLSLLAGQGAQMAMGGAYVLAQELARQDNHRAAFAAYQAFLKPHVDRKRRQAERFAKLFVPSEHSRPWLRRLVTRLLFGPIGLPLAMRNFATSALTGR